MCTRKGKVLGLVRSHRSYQGQPDREFLVQLFVVTFKSFVFLGKSIRTYKELLEEKKKLRELVEARRQLIDADVEELKSRLKPLSELKAHINQFTLRDAASLGIALNSDIIAKTIFKKIMVARGGWVAKVLVPYFLKKFTSSFFAEEKDKVIAGKIVVQGKVQMSYWL